LETKIIIAPKRYKDHGIQYRFKTSSLIKKISPIRYVTGKTIRHSVNTRLTMNLNKQPNLFICSSSPINRHLSANCRKAYSCAEKMRTREEKPKSANILNDAMLTNKYQ